MKTNGLAVLLMIIITSLGFAQEKQFDLGKSLSEIKEGTYKGPLLNNKLVEEFLNEYYAIMDKTIVTKGNEGCLFKDKIYPTQDVQVKDISGAGDTFISGLVCEFIRSKNIIEAIKFAQECATKVVQKKGVCTI